MGKKSIRELARRANTKRVKKFAIKKGFLEGGTDGDDVVYYHPTKKVGGMGAYIKITLNVKEGIPMDTLATMIRTSGLSKSDWANGL